MRHSLPEIDARRLLTGGPVLLVTTAWHGNTNVMPVAYAMPLSMEPPFVGIAVHPSRHTHDMIRYSEEFAINVPGRQLIHHVQYLASFTGAQQFVTQTGVSAVPQGA
jgi:flavin reductase (DIM6/NTAB) family NADH-FMN oxidoreductase RutF